jgi:Ion channel
MVAGIALILLMMNDVFQSVIVPRATGRRYRLSVYVWRAIWRLWPTMAWRLDPENGGRREEFLAAFAPFTLTLLIFLWASLLIVGFGLVLWGLRGGITPPRPTFGAVLYYAGTSLVTIGYGDIVSHGWAARLASVLAGLAGLSLLSITTAYLFAIFGSFQTRETFVVVIGARAGAPPSGVNLLTIAGYSRTREDLPPLMIGAQRWAAALMESHLAYPVLAFFRSSHDEQSWIGTLGTLLDAATLMMTTIDDPRDGQARLFYNVGRHATYDLSNYLMIRARVGEETVGIERSEFDDACDQLVEAGYKLRDRDEAWKRFSDLRSNYASRLNALARFFEIPPLQWIGDRSAIGASAHD